MPDHQFADTGLAALYDLFCPWGERDDFEFYLPRVMAARAVLDAGCGTGMLLHRARELGHTGRLCGLDPAFGMLEQARRRDDIEWIQGDLPTAAWDRAFDLIVMTGHAFQVLVEDSELRASLAAVRAALTDDGCFAFETRNPLVRAWEIWNPANATRVIDAAGAEVWASTEVEQPVQPGIVRFTTTYTSSGWQQPQQSCSTLRFFDAAEVAAFLAGAGLAIARQFGDWDGRPLSDEAPEIITFARRI